jgi:hypothetical protein
MKQRKVKFRVSGMNKIINANSNISTNSLYSSFAQNKPCFMEGICKSAISCANISDLSKYMSFFNSNRFEGGCDWFISGGCKSAVVSGGCSLYGKRACDAD